MSSSGPSAERRPIVGVLVRLCSHVFLVLLPSGSSGMLATSSRFSVDKPRDGRVRVLNVDSWPGDVIQLITRAEKNTKRCQRMDPATTRESLLSVLQHNKQSQAISPFSAMRTVKFLEDHVSVSRQARIPRATYVTLLRSVQQDPMKVRITSFRSLTLGGARGIRRFRQSNVHGFQKLYFTECKPRNVNRSGGWSHVKANRTTYSVAAVKTK